MFIVDIATNEQHLVHIVPIGNNDFKKLTVNRYFFNWKKLKNKELTEKEIQILTSIFARS